jgi:hypothetical protein
MKILNLVKRTVKILIANLGLWIFKKMSYKKSLKE